MKPLPETVSIMGVPIHAFTPTGLIDHLISASDHGIGGYLITPNVDHLRLVTHSPAMREFAMAADLRVADGMPLLWASRVQGTPLPGRVAGSDLIITLSAAAAAHGRSIYLVGGEPGVAEVAASVLAERFPGIHLAGTYFPPFGFESDDDELEQIADRIRSAQPDFVYVGLPFAKASMLVGRVQSSSPESWYIGLGISFSFVAGHVRRAPRWMQQTGLEWLHRLMQEPGRLARRYLVEGIPFLALLFSDAFRQRIVGTLAAGYDLVRAGMGGRRD